MQGVPDREGLSWATCAFQTAKGQPTMAVIDFERIADSLEGAGLKTAGHSGVG